MKIFAPFVVYACALSLLACSLSSRSTQQLICVEKEGKYGYVTIAGDTIVPCKYSLSYTDTISRLGFVYDEAQGILCLNNLGVVLFRVFNYDNGPDYPSEGLFRILDDQDMIGYADTLGNIVIEPIYKFAFPFEGGLAKVTKDGRKRQTEDHWYWESDQWITISHPQKSINLD